jgi:hypothetical protein
MNLVYDAPPLGNAGSKTRVKRGVTSIAKLIYNHALPEVEDSYAKPLAMVGNVMRFINLVNSVVFT